MESVLLLRHDKAGDALKTLQPLRALLASRPDLAIHLLASPHNASLFEYEPGISLHTLPDTCACDDQKFAKITGNNSYDVLVNLLCDATAESRHLLSQIPATKKYSIELGNFTSFRKYTRLSFSDHSPALCDESLNIARLLDQVFGTKIVESYVSFPQAPYFTARDHLEAQENMGEKKGEWLGLCPFAGTTHRTHPLKRWCRFIWRITQNFPYDKIFLFGAKSDETHLYELAKYSRRADLTQILTPSSFRSMGAYFLRLDRVVSVDSGPLHLARALSIPSLGFLSGGDANRWFARQGKSDRLVRRGIFGRYPSHFEMLWAYRHWIAKPIDTDLG